MENQDKIPFSPASLARIIHAQFPEIEEIADDSFWMSILIKDEIVKPSQFVQALYYFLQGFLELHGDPDENYQFTVQQDRELIDILHFNNPEAFHTITIDLFGKIQELRIQDVPGLTADYTIFDEHFEKIGVISLAAVSSGSAAVSQFNEKENFRNEVYPDFADDSIWKIEPKALQPYLTEIRLKLLEDISTKQGTMVVDLDDPEDLAFWAEQFELSEAELRKAVLSAGKSVDDITAYLQR